MGRNFQHGLNLRLHACQISIRDELKFRLVSARAETIKSQNAIPLLRRI